MNQVADSVNALFSSVSKNPKMAEDLEAVSFRVQFKPLDEPVFNIAIGRNGYTFSSGMQIEETDQDAIYMVEVEPCLKEIFSGEVTLGNMLFEHKIQIPGYRNKEPLIGAFSRFVRRAVWATIPGAAILRPVK